MTNTVRCKSVTGGWQTIKNGHTFGPVYNDIEKLWAWQKENLDDGGNFRYIVNIETQETKMKNTNIAQRILEMAGDLQDSLMADNASTLNSDEVMTVYLEEMVESNNEEILLLAKFRKAFAAGVGYDRDMLIQMLEVIMDMESEYN